MKIFTLDKKYQAVCDSQSTRYGFRHMAKLLVNGYEIEHNKCCYYNRTWECYEYQSVLKSLINKALKNKHLTDKEGKKFMKLIENNFEKEEHKRVEQLFKTTQMVASLGDIFCQSQTDSNKWKERMLKAGLTGLDFPSDWNTLSEIEKETRLDKIISLNK